MISMLCERARNLFSEYCEGAMQPALAVVLESHLQACEACRNEMEGVRAVYAALNEAPLVEPPADFRLRVWEKIDARLSAPEPARAGWRSFDWRAVLMPRRLAMGVAAAAAFFVLGVVAPGRYTQAGLYFPWSLFSRPAPSIELRTRPVVTRLPDGSSAIDFDFLRHWAPGAVFDLTLRDDAGVIAEHGGMDLNAGGPYFLRLPLKRPTFQGVPILIIRRSDTHAVVLEQRLQTLGGK
jgi:hypothetical protein